MSPSARPTPPSRPVLAYVEHHLPGASVDERIELARAHDLALEVAFRRDGANGDLAVVERSGVPIVTLQAVEMHELHPLHPDGARRRAGLAYALEAIDAAAALGVPRVLTACGFGTRSCARPFERCLGFYRELAPRARERGVRVLIELLSPRRAPAMTEPGELWRLIEALASPEVFGLALDLGHLADAGLDGEAVLAGWGPGVEELQLRGPCSRPPAADFPLARLLARLPGPPAVACVEHPRPIEHDRLLRLVEHLRRELSAPDE